MAKRYSSLVGKYFFCFNPEEDGEQGRVVRNLSADFYLVEYFIGLLGDQHSVLKIKQVSGMIDWWFYSDREVAAQHFEALLQEPLSDIDPGQNN